MRIHVIAVGTRMPAWVAEGFREYQRRLAGGMPVQLVEVGAEKRRKGVSPDILRHREGERLLAAIPANSLPVALDQRGMTFTTEELAENLRRFEEQGNSLALLVGGADGLSPACMDRVVESWSLSALTFPHSLVRVIIVEQLYRAVSILRGHPYHRA